MEVNLRIVTLVNVKKKKNIYIFLHYGKRRGSNDLYSHIIPTNNPHMDRYILITVGEISHDVARLLHIIHSLDPHNQRWQPQISPFQFDDFPATSDTRGYPLNIPWLIIIHH